MQFDTSCLGKLRKEEIVSDVCDRTHTFTHVPAWDLESAKRAKEGKVFVDGKICKIEDWLGSIKQEWGLEI